MLESFSSVVRVAVETSESQVEVELVPAVEIPTCWPKKARWPRCLKRWPSQEKVQCMKVNSVKSTINSVLGFTSQMSDSADSGFPTEGLHGRQQHGWKVYSLEKQYFKVLSDFTGTFSTPPMVVNSMGENQLTVYCMSLSHTALPA